MNEIKLTIGIPSIPSRIRMGLEPLLHKLQSQIGQRKDVEVISLLDNKTMSVGRKRQILFQIARGKYVCQIDDDDGVEPDFIETVLNSIEQSVNDPPEVISFQQKCDIDGQIMFVECDINETTVSNPIFDHNKNKIIIKRFPWHWCCWRSDIAKSGHFYDSNGIEDSLFATEMKKIVKTELKIEKVLLKYNFKSSNTNSPYFNIDKNNEPKKCSVKISE